MVTDACGRALLLFDVYITLYFLVQDRYTPLLMCYRCYEFESHVSSAIIKFVHFVPPPPIIILKVTVF